jgi:ferredoxin-type protein NapH
VVQNCTNRMSPYQLHPPKIGESVIVFIIILFLLLIVETKTPAMMLLGGRFFGWYGSVFQSIILATYGALLYRRLIYFRTFISAKTFAWTLFSVVFFSQLILGIFVNDTFLMTGTLHLPVPMLIIAGPVYRYEIGFMLILFISTILLVGPGWCSYLCYFGVIDYRASQPSKLSKHLFPKQLPFLKIIAFILIIAGAITLRFVGISNTITIWIVICYAIIGLIIIWAYSVQKKKMYHCSMYCPVHSSAIILKHLNPFRMRIDTQKCTKCMKCVHVCKYFAMFPIDVERGKPNIMCTYCGDCITVCDDNAIMFSLAGISSYYIRNVYFIIITIVHAVFLGLARI